MSTLFAALFSFVLRLGFYLLALFAAFGVLLLGALALVWMLLRALLTGRKPMPWVLWQQYRSAASQARTRWQSRAGQGAADGGAAGGRSYGYPGRASAADVVDVEARELPARHLPNH